MHSHVGDNVISMMEISKYQHLPYIILKCCNIVLISLLYNVFRQYYFGQLFLYFSDELQKIKFSIDHHCKNVSESLDTSVNVSFFDVPSECIALQAINVLKETILR